MRHARGKIMFVHTMWETKMVSSTNYQGVIMVGNNSLKSDINITEEQDNVLGKQADSIK